jgi:Tol biopolymer transport system component
VGGPQRPSHPAAWSHECVLVVLDFVSPDGRRLATVTVTHRESSLWANELDRDSPIWSTTSGQVGGVEWTPDGRRLVCSAGVEGVEGLFVSPADGTGSPERIDLTLLGERSSADR